MQKKILHLVSFFEVASERICWEAVRYYLDEVSLIFGSYNPLSSSGLTAHRSLDQVITPPC